MGSKGQDTGKMCKMCWWRTCDVNHAVASAGDGPIAKSCAAQLSIRPGTVAGDDGGLVKMFFVDVNFSHGFWTLLKTSKLGRDFGVTEVRSTEASLNLYPPKTQEQNFHTCWNLFFHRLVFNFHVKPNLQIQTM